MFTYLFFRGNSILVSWGLVENLNIITEILFAEILFTEILFTEIIFTEIIFTKKKEKKIMFL